MRNTTILRISLHQIPRNPPRRVQSLIITLQIPPWHLQASALIHLTIPIITPRKC